MTKRITADHVKLKRAYEPAAAGDGTRILFDRSLGSKADGAIDQWVTDIAPSAALRKWFGYDPPAWAEFPARDAVEVHRRPEHLSRLRALARQGPITLIYLAHDEVHNALPCGIVFWDERRSKRRDGSSIGVFEESETMLPPDGAMASPGDVVMREYGFTAENVCERSLALLR
jgi:uncharacterized protein YeaO (DUF488 family)